MNAVVRQATRRSPRERALSGAILSLTAVMAVVVPGWAHRHLDQRVTGDLAPALSRTVGAQVQVGRVDASLVGTVRLLDVRLGRTIMTDALEASVALSPARILSGDRSFRASELRIEGPRLRLTMDRSGQMNMDALLGRLRRRFGNAAPADGPAGDSAAAAAGAAAGAAGAGTGARSEGARSEGARSEDARSEGARSNGAAGARVPGMLLGLRRVLVAGGALTVEVGDCGRIHARGVALHSHRSGIRAVVDNIAVDVRCGAWEVTGTMGRAAADVRLPTMELERFLSVGGRLEILPVLAPGAAAAASEAPAPGEAPAPIILPATILVDVAVAHGVDAPGGTELHGRQVRAGEDTPWRAHLVREAGDQRLRLEGQDLALSALAPLMPRSIDLSQARGSGWIDLTLGERFGLAMDASVAGLVLDDPRVSLRPVALAGALDASIVGARDAVDIERLRFTAGALQVEASGHLAYDAPGDSPHGDDDPWLPDRGTLRVQVPPVACADALASIPAGMREDLDGMLLTGDLAVTAALRFDRHTPADTELDMDLDVDRCRVLQEATGADPQRLLASFDHRFSNGKRARLGPGAPRHVLLSTLPAHVAQAFVSAEDGRFFAHEGFDLYQIERSLAVDLREGAFVRGGSTISQQLVKNLFLSQHRTLARKLQEAVLTWRLEAHLDKPQILEHYLNIVELGPGIFGVDAAARYWFGKAAPALGLREAAFLAALTPAPQSLSRRILRAGGIDASIEERVDLVLRAMRRDRALTEAAYQRARREPLVLREGLGTPQG